MSEQKQVALTQFSSTATPSGITWLEPLLGLLAGTLGGIVESRILEGSAAHEILLGALFGLAFGLFFAKRATTPGAGLIWGSSAAFLFWVAVHAGATLWFTKAAHSPEMLPRLRQHFDDLVSYVVRLGMPVGVLLGIRGSLRPPRQLLWRSPRLPRLPAAKPRTHPIPLGPRHRCRRLFRPSGRIHFWHPKVRRRFFSAACRNGRDSFPRHECFPALLRRRSHRLCLRAAFSARCVRLWLLHGLGPRLRDSLVVSRPAHLAAVHCRQQA